jgi:lipopolysaccharide transport system ATP-binding protein
MAYAIRARGVGKTYRIPKGYNQFPTIRDAIMESITAPLRWYRGESLYRTFEALKDVSFDVNKGDVIGIIGRNGAGKSTLLKIMSRITFPTTGMIELYGTTGSILEVGTGFNQEFTGRENIFLTGSILGMKRREVEAKMDAIIKFSEVEKYIDMPIKRYSSGMQVKLAFSIARFLDSEILFLDEVLAVGDAAFRKKCLDGIYNICKNEGRTVLFVSHDMEPVLRLCDYGMWIDHGSIRMFEDVEPVVEEYGMNWRSEIATPTTPTEDEILE